MKYVVAVSGGIDSVVMLDILAKHKEHELVVAHVDHGIRSDSEEDAVLVRRLAADHNLPYVSVRLELGSLASEEQARTARHAWLQEQLCSHAADAIATAHHEDDVLETIAINIVRGTGWRGLCSLRETSQYVRPLLRWSKAQIVDYAIEHELEWHEDETNYSARYLRNRLRNGGLTKLDPEQRRTLLNLYYKQAALLAHVEHETSQLAPGSHSRYFITMLEPAVASEILRDWLGESLETRRLVDLWLFIKTAKNGASWSLDGQRFVTLHDDQLVVSRPEK